MGRYYVRHGQLDAARELGWDGLPVGVEALDGEVEATRAERAARRAMIRRRAAAGRGGGRRALRRAARARRGPAAARRHRRLPSKPPRREGENTVGYRDQQFRWSWALEAWVDEDDDRPAALRRAPVVLEAAAASDDGRRRRRRSSRRRCRRAAARPRASAASRCPGTTSSAPSSPRGSSASPTVPSADANARRSWGTGSGRSSTTLCDGRGGALRGRGANIARDRRLYRGLRRRPSSPARPRSGRQSRMLRRV